MSENQNFRKENQAVLYLEPILILLLLVLGDIYRIHLEYTMYAIACSGVAWLLVVVFQYHSFRKRQELQKKEDKLGLWEREKEEKVYQSMREKEDFFAMWAHQIKTPIAAINVLLQSEEQDVAACKQEIFKIENYVEMALNYLRFETMGNDMVLTACSLEEMTKQVIKKFSTIFIHKHLSVKLENLDYMILTDEKWFVFVFEQIVSNALKYTRKGSVTISAKEQEGELIVSIKDTGIGIRREDIPRLFEKGFTGYNGRMDKKASGLGLYLCKGVCDKLGHGLRISSEEKVGTEVIVTVYCEKLKRTDLTKM